jgi:hypothetical protein
VRPARLGGLRLGSGAQRGALGAGAVLALEVVQLVECVAEVAGVDLVGDLLQYWRA